MVGVTGTVREFESVDLSGGLVTVGLLGLTLVVFESTSSSTRAEPTVAWLFIGTAVVGSGSGPLDDDDELPPYCSFKNSF